MSVEPCVSISLDAWSADGVTPDGDGIIWNVQRIDGWFDSAALRVEYSEVFPQGQVVTLARENARAISLLLVAQAQTPDAALGAALCYKAMDTIEAAFSNVYAPGTFSVADPVLTLYAYVRRVGQIQKRIVGQSVAMQCQIPLLAEDPYRWDAGPGAGTAYD